MDEKQLREQYPDLVAQIEETARKGMIAQAEADTARAEAVTAETGRVLGVITAVVGEEPGKKLSTIVDAGLDADKVKDLGLSLAAEGGGAHKQMLDAITGAAPAPVQGAKPAAGEQAERSAVASAIAAGGSR